MLQSGSGSRYVVSYPHCYILSSVFSVIVVFSQDSDGFRSFDKSAVTKCSMLERSQVVDSSENNKNCLLDAEIFGLL